MAAQLSVDDLAAYAPVERTPVSTDYRGRSVIGPPPPASGGVHIAQMLNILEGFDIAAMGFGSPDSIHLLAEILKIAFADRAITVADPAFVKAPIERVISKAYASERRAEIDLQRARQFAAGHLGGVESSDTTHVTVADADGFVVSATQTINGLFGACVQIPGTGMIANNYMHNFDPHPGRVLSIAPGKRVFSSMAPMMVTEGGKVRLALGLPGALRIFPVGVSGDRQLDRSRHGRAGGGRGAAHLDRGRVARARTGVLGCNSRRADEARPHDPTHEAHRRRHERDCVFARRHDDRRRLLARRRHASRHRGRTSPARHQVRDDIGLKNGEFAE